jgi:hypothetical protein
MKLLFQIAFLLLFFSVQGFGQDTILLKNPSFENDQPAAGRGASEWLDMGAPTDSPPDIQPGQFSVSLPAQHGKVYLGLVTRDINTWEGMGQQLDGYMMKDSAYSFSLWLARSNLYLSTSKLLGKQANYDKPVVLKIWGVNTSTKQEELLVESPVYNVNEWALYSFTLKPTVADFDEIDLIAYYAPGYEKTNGNLLIDNCSAIVKITNPK